MGGELTELQALDIWRRAIVNSVRLEAPDLSARQMAILLTVYTTPPPHTVRGLATGLKISKPAVTRALDRLGTLGYIRRSPEDTDKRSIHVQRTVRGAVFLSEFADIIESAAWKIGSDPKP